MQDPAPASIRRKTKKAIIDTAAAVPVAAWEVELKMVALVFQARNKVKEVEE